MLARASGSAFLPAGVERVEAVNDDARRVAPRERRRQVGEGGLDQAGVGRHARRRIAANLGVHGPAGRGEGLCGGEAEAAVGAEYQDGGTESGGHNGSFGKGQASCR